MATRRRVRRKSISGNITDVQKRIKYLETRPSATRLASKVVSTKNLALRSVEEDIVADNAIVRRTIAASAVGTAEIEQDSITNALIASNAINADSFAPSSVGTTELKDDSVTNDKIAINAVDSRNIAAGAVGNDELEGNIENSKISGMSSSKLIDQIEDSQISSLSASKVSGVLDTDNIPDLATSKITSGVFNLQRIPEITEDRMPNLDTSKITTGVFDLDRIPEITADRMPNLDASKFTTGIFEETNIPNLPASKITSGIFFEGRIPDLSTQKLATGVLAVARMPVFPESEISSFAVTTEKIRDGSVLSTKITNNNFTTLLSNTFVATNPVIDSASFSQFNLTMNIGSTSNQVAAGNHVHGSGGYSNAGSTGVASHTHGIAIASNLVQNLGNPTSHTRLSGGAEGAAAHGSGFHQHSQPSFSGTATSNTSTLKLKKEISNYEVPNIKKLLNLQLKRYKYKNQVRYLQESINREWMYGYIAEEVEDLGFKELVGYDEKGEPASLNYGLLSTLVLELVKVQQSEISLIKEKIKRQRKKYDKLSS